MSIRSRSLITGSICSCPLCVDSAVVPRTTLFFLDDPVRSPRGSGLMHCEQYTRTQLACPVISTLQYCGFAGGSRKERLFLTLDDHSSLCDACKLCRP
jgi:hypothetical protein